MLKNKNKPPGLLSVWAALTCFNMLHHNLGQGPAQAKWKKCSWIIDGDNHLCFLLKERFFSSCISYKLATLCSLTHREAEAGQEAGCLGLQWQAGRIWLAREEQERLSQSGQRSTLTKSLESHRQHRNLRTTSSAGARTRDVSMVIDGHHWCPPSESGDPSEAATRPKNVWSLP